MSGSTPTIRRDLGLCPFGTQLAHRKHVTSLVGPLDRRGLLLASVGQRAVLAACRGIGREPVRHTNMDSKEIAMTPLMSKPSGAAPATLVYITLGAIMTVWSGIWYMYLSNYPPSHQAINYICYGFLITGIVLLLIGIILGPISRWARHAELPPVEATGTAMQSEQTAGARRVV